MEWPLEGAIPGVVSAWAEVVVRWKRAREQRLVRNRLRLRHRGGDIEVTTGTRAGPMAGVEVARRVDVCIFGGVRGGGGLDRKSVV